MRDLFACLQGRSVKNNIQANTEEPEELKRAPHSIVIHRGNVGRYVLELTRDFRKVMEPFTASSLKVSGLHVAKWSLFPSLHM
jgi:ribosome biogenesis protein SSF1/2